MMSISEIVQTAGWRKFMAKLYGFGASIVLAGALFKLQHWPMAGLMLTVGMTTEALIFAISAFEPVHEEVDWTLVYPELAGIEEDEEDNKKRNPSAHRGATPQPSHSGGDGQSPGGGGGSLTKFDQMMENAEITPELFDQLGDGLKKLNETARNINNVSDASLATDQYVNTMQAASESVNLLTDAYNKSKESLNQSINQLSGVYQESADMIRSSGQEMAQKISESSQEFSHKVTQSGEELANSYKEIADMVKSDVVQGNNAYNEKLEALNKNLAALNDAYELQLNTTKKHVKNAEDIYGAMDQVINDLRGSADETRKYREELSKLNQSLADLNGVYGNMLSAMSVMSNNS
jgi:gliding motility-associated protein GldL